MQIRIALCDDETTCHKITQKLLAEYLQTTSALSFTLSCFSSGGELLDYIDKNGTFDLYLLDIIMPKMDGIRLGTLLRKQHDDGMIIYLTSSPDFAVESYNTDALHYLLKPIDRRQFFQCMDKAVRHFNRFPVQSISIKTSGSIRIVLIRDILYAECLNRRIRYYLNDSSVIDSVTFGGTFHRAIAPLTAFCSFLAVGSSFVVNLDHVTEITRTNMVLDKGHLVPIPRRTYETVKSKWADYWLNKGDIHVI